MESWCLRATRERGVNVQINLRALGVTRVIHLRLLPGVLDVTWGGVSIQV